MVAVSTNEWTSKDRKIVAFWTFMPPGVVLALGTGVILYLIVNSASPAAVGGAVAAVAALTGAVFTGCLKAVPMIVGGIGIERPPPVMSTATEDDDP